MKNKNPSGNPEGYFYIYEKLALFQIENSRSGRYNLITAGGQTKKGVFKKWKKNFIS